MLQTTNFSSWNTRKPKVCLPAALHVEVFFSWRPHDLQLGQLFQGQSTVWFVLLVSSSVLSSTVFSPLRIAYIFWLVNTTIALWESKAVERRFLRFSFILRSSMSLFARGLNLADRYAWSLGSVDPTGWGEHWLILTLSLHMEISTAMRRCCSAEVVNSESFLGWISSKCYVTQVFIQLEHMYYSWSTCEFSFFLMWEQHPCSQSMWHNAEFSLIKQFHCNMHLRLESGMIPDFSVKK